MMSLWDALRMNMMISYQELVRTFLKRNRQVLLHTILNFSMYCRCLISSHTGKLVWVSDKYVKLTAPQYQPHAVSR
ncbi:hypothetical protein DS972_26770 [Escherichia coli]|nr:hypothetical protein DS968_26340 [Escherichia coli]RBX85631.1 hypothetical protein DS974_26840 [Escherichia coli]RBX98456.1 hypothetical protein DS972_26770 [Escherichia coli]RBY41811.1 hypothetical protein DS989_26585 [Escherichia coli]RCY66589.1 hypothetical protein DTL90_26850 [Escherichia coli]